MSSGSLSAASKRLIWTSGLLAALLCTASWVVAPPQSIEWGPLLVFAAMFVVSEWLTIPIGERGVQVSVSLPVVAAVAVLYGPAVAGVMDVCGTVAAGSSRTLRSRSRRRWMWLLFNCSQAAMCASAAGLAAFSIRALLSDGLALVLAALVATLVYIVLNSVTVASMEASLSGSHVMAKLDEKRRVIGYQYLLYALLAILVMHLAATERVWVSALFLLPMWAAWQCFQLRARYERDYRETIRALGLMIQRAHPYTGGHLDRVAHRAARTAERLGLPPNDVDLMQDAALLHDVGKIAVDEAVLNFPGPLDEEQWQVVRKHPEIGAEILGRIQLLEPIVPWIQAHHERPDGKGYPSGLRDAEIPVQAKIIAVVDAYDAMVGGERPGEQRPYRKSVTPEEALEELRRCAGTQFDARVVEEFTATLREEGVL